MIPAIGSTWSREDPTDKRLCDSFVVLDVVAVPPGGWNHPKHPGRCLPGLAGDLVAVGNQNGAADLSFIPVAELLDTWTP